MPIAQEREGIQVQSERAVLAAVRLPTSVYDHADPFGELRALAEQAGAVVVGELTQNSKKPVAGTYMGVGKIEELKQLCVALEASTVIFDHDLSPKQIAGIEKVVGKKVIDRSELILDIFAARANSTEAQLQVELAQLQYTYPRLKAMWSHLERIVGSGGIAGVGTRGPGEMQLEIDRRLVQSRKNDLQKAIKVVQDRKAREVMARKAENFTVGIVGYTNAGKSTLFNSLTTGGAYADNRLFATLMTRTRQWDLGGGLNVLLSDTVGFVRDLPHNLIAAFRATLEEATHADVQLIVVDVADAAADLQYQTVIKTLDELQAEVDKREESGKTPAARPQRIVLLNKVDRLKDNASLLVWQEKAPGAIPICALSPQKGADGKMVPRRGQDELIAQIRELAKGRVEELEITVPMRESKTVHLIENLGEVLEREYDTTEVKLRVRIGRSQLDRIRVGGAKMMVRTMSGEELFPPRTARSKGWEGKGV